MLGVRSPGTGPWGTHGSLSAQWQVGTQQGSASPSQVCVRGGVGVLAGAHASSKQGSPLPLVLCHVPGYKEAVACSCWALGGERPRWTTDAR